MSPASHVDVKNGGRWADLGLAAAAKAIGANRVSAAAYMEACLARIDARESAIHAFAHLGADYAMRRAYVSDRLPTDKRGPLHGVPFTAAEVIDIKGMRCARGSALNADRVAPADASIVEQARGAGGIVLGAAAAAEFGCFGLGPVRNPHAADRSSGGSGAAAAVASGMAPVAFDARPDGPISQPASFCGIYGLSVARGAFPPEGVLSLAPSLESKGLYVRDAEDIGYACRLFLGASSIPEAREELAYRMQGLTVRLVDGPSGYRVRASGRSAINRAVTALSDKRVECTRFRLPPRFVKAESCYDVIFSYEMSRRLSRDRDRLAEGMNAVTLARIDKGRRIEASTYEQARRDAIALRSELLEMLSGDSVILDAAAEGEPPLHSDDAGPSALQALWAIAGVPVLAIPCGTAGGLPVGVQIAAAPGREDLLARLACIIEDGMA